MTSSPIPDTAVVLAGSPAAFQGVTLASYPKVFLPLANRPLLHYQARILAEVGVKRLIICVDSGMAEVVAPRLSTLPGSLAYLIRETSYGTGGSLQQIKDAIGAEAFWVIGGDLLPGTGLAEMLALHQQRREVATVGVFQVREAPWEMERVECDEKRQVKAVHRLHPFQEKRSTSRPAGLYLFQPEILNFIPASRHFDLKEQLFGGLYRNGTPAGIWELPECSRAITSIGDFLGANLEVLKGHLPFSDQGRLESIWLDARFQIDPSAKVINPVVFGSGCRTGNDVIILGPTAVGSRCELGSQVVINECVIMDNVHIGQGAYLHRCVVSEGARVPAMANLEETVVARSMTRSSEPGLYGIKEQTQRHRGYAAGAQGPRTAPERFYPLIRRRLDSVLALLGFSVRPPRESGRLGH